MVVLIVKKYDEIQEVIGPFKDNDDADEYCECFTRRGRLSFSTRPRFCQHHYFWCLR